MLAVRFYNRGMRPTVAGYEWYGHDWRNETGRIKFLSRQQVRISAEGVTPWTLTRVPRHDVRTDCF